MERQIETAPAMSNIKNRLLSCCCNMPVESSTFSECVSRSLLLENLFLDRNPWAELRTERDYGYSWNVAAGSILLYSPVAT